MADELEELVKGIKATALKEEAKNSSSIYAA
ncbi:hypothetical protein C5S39_12500 [Candidatus Methanophagaceae archaeon]|nr:hypothetical protein C5S39_12500 [Methanophagales archaeon]